MSKERGWVRLIKESAVLAMVVTSSCFVVYEAFQVINPILDRAVNNLFSSLFPDQHKIQVRFYRPADFTAENQIMDRAISTVEAKQDK